MLGLEAEKTVLSCFVAGRRILWGRGNLILLFCRFICKDRNREIIRIVVMEYDNCVLFCAIHSSLLSPYFVGSIISYLGISYLGVKYMFRGNHWTCICVHKTLYARKNIYVV